MYPKWTHNQLSLMWVFPSRHPAHYYTLPIVGGKSGPEKVGPGLISSRSLSRERVGGREGAETGPESVRRAGWHPEWVGREWLERYQTWKKPADAGPVSLFLPSPHVCGLPPICQKFQSHLEMK